MARWAPLKKDQLEALAAEILHNYGTGRTIVAVEGDSLEAAGLFADDLAEALQIAGERVRVFRASLSNFHRPRVDRESAPLPPAQAYYENAFDYSVLRRVLVEPFRAGGSTGFVLAAFDAQRDTAMQSKWTTAGANAVLVVDGEFVNRPEISGLWNYSVWLDGEPSEPSTPQGAAQALYRATVTPRSKASAILDNRDPEIPRRVFADSC
jgi:uridine kinase